MSGTISIIFVLLSAIAIPISLIPDTKKKWRFWANIALCCALAGVGVLNQYFTNKSQEEFDEQLRKMATTYRWDEAIVEVQGHFIQPGAKASMVLIIADKEKAEKNKKFSPWTNATSINEVATYSDQDAAAMIGGVNKDGKLKEMYDDGTYAIWAEGVADQGDTVKCNIKDYTRWPNLYPSLRDLKGKMVFGVLAVDDPKAVVTWLTIRLKTAAGYKDFSCPFRLVNNGKLIASPIRLFAFEPKL